MMKLPVLMILVFSGLGALTVWWGNGRIRRIALGRMPVLIGEAMARLGLTPRDAESAGLEGAVLAAGERCRTCDEASVCRDWLAEGLVATREPRCPNQALFERIRAQRVPEPPRPPRNLGAY